MVKRQGTGRKKIEIKKMNKKDHIKTTFTKRRKGLFKKIEELCNLFGINATVITFSPCGGRPYAFGLPCSKKVIDRFLCDNDKDCVVESETSVGEDGFCWWNKSTEGMELNELEQYKGSLLKLNNNVISKLQDLQSRRVALRDFFA